MNQFSTLNQFAKRFSKVRFFLPYGEMLQGSIELPSWRKRRLCQVYKKWVFRHMGEKNNVLCCCTSVRHAV